MCNFISWIEYKNEILFLTKNELETSRGKALRKHLGPQFENDVKGHGAIEWYYKLKGNTGRHKECEDFSSPKNFPAVIVKAIKNGEFCGIGIAKNILTRQARAEYEKIKGQAWAEYEKIQGPARAEFEKIKGPARAEFEKIRGQARAEFEKIQGQARAEYKKIQGQAWAEYEKIQGPAWAEFEKIQGPARVEYEKIQGQAWAEFEKIQGQAFWKIAKKKDNRRKEWK